MKPSTLNSSETSSRCACARSSSGTPICVQTSRSTTRMRSDIIEQGAGGAVEVHPRRLIGRNPPVIFRFVVEGHIQARCHGGIVEQEEMGLLEKLGRLDAVLHQLKADVGQFEAGLFPDFAAKGV